MCKDRVALYNSIKPFYSFVEVTGGFSKGVKGLVIRKSRLRTETYDKKKPKTYNSYFTVALNTNNGIIHNISCNFIKKINNYNY